MLESIDTVITSTKRFFKNYNKLLMFTFIAIIFCFVLHYIYRNYVLSILYPTYKGNNEYSKKLKSEKQHNIIMFYADWCPHCIKAKPEWNNLQKDYHLENAAAKKINGQSIYFRQIDCSGKENEGIMDEYNVESFPTIVLENSDKSRFYFDAKPTYDNLENFLKMNL